MKKYFVILLLITSISGYGQLFEDFSDGNFSQAPVWNGDTSFWKVNAQQELQSVYSAVSQNIYLSTSYSRAMNVSWQFLIRMQFNPSASNQFRVYLLSDQENLEGSLQGYFIRIGEDGSEDSFDLYRQNGTALTKLIDGKAKRAVGDQIYARILVNRDQHGSWNLYTDTAGGFNFISEGDTSEATLTGGTYFGISAKYTSTRSDKFFFDELKIVPFEKDTSVPKLVSVQVVDSLNLVVQFSEALSQISASDSGHFLLDNQPGIISKAIPNGDTVFLQLVNGLTQGIHSLRAKHITDPENNEADSTFSLPFYYKKPFEAVYGQLLINEIFADPNPAVDLPAAEFVELRNLTDETIHLEGWTFSDAASQATFKNDSILPGGFLILCAPADTAAYQSFGEVTGLSGFPLLNNPGDHLRLSTSIGVLIDSVSYSDSWYGDPGKKEGGYSLERIYTQTSCPIRFNWTASTDISGGTPGKINAADGSNDSLVPQLLSLKVQDAQSLLLTFNKTLNPAIALNAAHYSVKPTGNPAMVDLPDQWSVRLSFSQPFSKGIFHSLYIDSLSDCGGLQLNPANISFFLPKPAEEGQVLINELFADPSPVIGLPDAEYIELYNPTAQVIRLTNWILSDSTSIAVFKNDSIMPGSFLIVCSIGDTSLFKPYGKAAGLSGFPSLNNSNDHLFLTSKEGILIDSVTYSDTWYRDELKEEGGYSLERIHLKTPCITAANWIASSDPKGGTPGQPNAADGSNDTLPPQLVSADILNEHTLLLRFNEPLDPATAFDRPNYEITLAEAPDLITMPDHSSVQLSFAELFTKGIYHTLVAQNLTDCAGNRQLHAEFNFILALPIEKGDVLINEVLFNPYPDGADFVEIYNRSAKLIDLSSLYIARSDEKDSITHKARISGQSKFLQPGHYLALSTDPADIRHRYFTPYPEEIIAVTGIPAFPDASGTVVLLNDSLETIDQLRYDENMHFGLINDPEGISLERIRFTRPAEDRSNWHSAASSAGFATPAYRNSQAQDEQAIHESLTIEPAVFSPDNDGQNDLLSIYYAFGRNGLLGNLQIYNEQGLLIKRLAKSEVLAPEGIYVWDGTDEDHQYSSTGIYIIYFEVIDSSGNAAHFKRTAVLDLLGR